MIRGPRGTPDAARAPGSVSFGFPLGSTDGGRTAARRLGTTGADEEMATRHDGTCGEAVESAVGEAAPASWIWLVLHTKPNQEKTAVAHLAQRGVEPYCPMFLEPRWHRRAPRGPVPLFTSYVFVRCDPSAHLARVAFCPGVLRPVSFVRQLATVEPELVDSLRQRSGTQGYIVAEEMSETIPSAARVEVLDGPLRGMEGVLRGYLRGGQRAMVLLRLLREQRLIEVDAGALRYLRG